MFLGLGDKCLDAMICQLPSFTVIERSLVFKYRMGIKKSHSETDFLRDPEHLISPCLFSHLYNRENNVYQPLGAVRLN